MIGEPESKIRNFFTSQIDLKNRVNVYSTATRSNALDFNDTVAFPKKGEKKEYEYIFRTLNYKLMTFIREEFNFCLNFFGFDLSSSIFEKTVNMMIKHAESFIEKSYDCIGMLIVQCINNQYQQEMQNAEIDSLDFYAVSIKELITERYSNICKLHIDSIIKATGKDLGSIDPRAPHYVVRRFAEFFISTLVLFRDFPEALADIPTVLFQLRKSLNVLLRNISQEIESPKDRIIFMINNYDLIMTLANEKKVTSIDIQKVDIKLQDQNASYANYMLKDKLTSFIEFTDKHAKLEDDEVVLLNEEFSREELVDVMKSFKGGKAYEKSFKLIFTEIMKVFSNFENGIDILQLVKMKMVYGLTVLNKMVNVYYPELVGSEWYLSERDLQYCLKDYVHYGVDDA